MPAKSVRECARELISHVESAESGYIPGCGNDLSWRARRDELVTDLRLALDNPELLMAELSNKDALTLVSEHCSYGDRVPDAVLQAAFRLGAAGREEVEWERDEALVLSGSRSLRELANECGRARMNEASLESRLARVTEAARALRMKLLDELGVTGPYIAMQREIDAVDAALSDAPDDRVLAPREPTEAMIAAGWDVEELKTPERIYRAMLAASEPKP